MSEDLAFIAKLVNESYSCITDGQPERAAWRLADAGLALREYLETHGYAATTGVDEPTGKGARLPIRVIH